MKRLVMSLPLLLGACGTLPEPFYGDPGTAGARLAVPPAPVLIIPSLQSAGLNRASGQLYANDLASALAALDVPSVAGPVKPAQWRLSGSAKVSGNIVTPSYGITGPDGKTYGVQTGTPVEAASWAAGDPATLNQEAATDALAISNKLASINAAVQQSNPNSLENRPPRVFLGPVTGAPGDGDNALSLAMRRDLPGAKTEMVTDAAAADFTVTGQVKTHPEANNRILVELDWVVEDSSRRKIGQVTQLHELTPSDIEPYWGDVAAAAGAEAAAGVNDVITNATLHKTPQLAFAPNAADGGDGAPLLIPASFALPAPSEARNHALFGPAQAPAAGMVAETAPPRQAAAPAGPAMRVTADTRPVAHSNPFRAIANMFRSSFALAGDLIGRIGMVFNPPPHPVIEAKPAEPAEPAQATQAVPGAPAGPVAAARARPRFAAIKHNRVLARHENPVKPELPYLEPVAGAEANPALALIRPLVYTISAPAPSAPMIREIAFQPAPAAKRLRTASQASRPHAARHPVAAAKLAEALPSAAAPPPPPPPSGATAPLMDPTDSIER